MAKKITTFIRGKRVPPSQKISEEELHQMQVAHQQCLEDLKKQFPFSGKVITLHDGKVPGHYGLAAGRFAII